MSQTQAKAWTFTTGGYPSSLRLSSITPPAKNEVKPNHILIKIHAAALNPVDIQIMNLPLWSIPLPMLQAEKTICSDFSGTVIQGGEGSGFSEGDEVFGVHMKSFNPCAGSLSEIAHMDLSSTCLTKKKPGWRHEQAAGLGCAFLTARTSIDRVAPWVEKSTTKRLVVLAGSSSCGIYTIQLAKKRGWKVLSTCSGKNAEFVKGLGADEVVDYTKQNVREAVKAFKPDAVVDNVGGTECVGLSKRYVTIVGDKTNRLSMGGPLTYYITFAPRQWIRWAMGKAGFGEVYDVIQIDLNNEWLDEAKDLDDNKIIIDSEFSFEDVKQAYERLNTSRARGKVIVKVAQ